MLVAQASGTQVESFWCAIYNNGNRMNVGYPAPVSMALRMAYVMTKLR